MSSATHPASTHWFFTSPTVPGVLLMVMASLAMLAANSPFEGLYGKFLGTVATVSVGDYAIAKPLLLWINDGLMAVFFLLVGIEIKAEVLHGELSSRSRALLPVVGAFGGVMVPAAVYYWFNAGDEVAMRGWAIPVATDIAFAVGLLALVGTRAPVSLRVFLLTLAIVDDLLAIVLIAIFYTVEISFLSLVVATFCVGGFVALRIAKVRRLDAYLLVGMVLWVAVLKSGVHATLAGVLIALFLPSAGAHELRERLLPWSNLFILPLFAFANAGVGLLSLTWADFIHPVPLGIALGLFVGKQLGVFIPCWLCVQFKWAQLPRHASWLQFYGLALLAGVGFTMSLFIASLAFEQGAGIYVSDHRLGIVMGSVLSAVMGLLILRFAPTRPIELART